jgi:tRNA(Arg) A34 adenosine deaminase TadA
VSELFALTDPVVWLVTSRLGAEATGMIATWVSQASLSARHPRALVVLSREARTMRAIDRSGRFALQLLDQSQRPLVERFALPFAGDRWADVASTQTSSGLPLAKGGCGYVECLVSDRLGTGDRVVVLGAVVEERVEPGAHPLREREALTQQPSSVAAALRKSYEIDVLRDDRLLDAASLGTAPAEPRAVMQLAIEKTREGFARGQGPFGCAIVRDGKLLAVEHNRVLDQTDTTAHAEITALRVASRRAGSYRLPGAFVYATCEPCPMCMAALHFAEVAEVVFGASIDDAERAGFRQIHFAAEELARVANSATRVRGGLASDACRALFAEWSSGR